MGGRSREDAERPASPDWNPDIDVSVDEVMGTQVSSADEEEVPMQSRPTFEVSVMRG